MISSSQSDFLNLSRWVAALLVVVEHVRSLLFVDYGSIAAPRLIDKGFYFATGFGHEAVVIFFVASGFLVGGKTLEAFRLKSFDWRRYLLDRISRLYAVLIAALLLGAFLDVIGSTYFDSFGLYSNATSQSIAVVSGSFVQRLSVPHFVSSVAMLQEIWLPSFGSNGPLWSLAHEWWYYILFPLLISCGFSSKPHRKVVAVCIIGLICWMLTVHILILGGVWLIGAATWLLNSRSWTPSWVSALLVLLTLVCMRLELNWFPYAHHYLLGSAFALTLNSFATSTRHWPLTNLSGALADFSYSLYLLHFPVVILAISVFFQYYEARNRLSLSIGTLSLFLVITSLAYGISYAVASVTESKTKSIRVWLYGRFGVTGARRT